MDNTLITQDRLNELCRLISLTPPGLCAEIGVYKGGSLKEMATRHPDREFWGFDTFEGLPIQDWKHTEIHKPEEFNDTSFVFVSNFLKECKNVTLLPGYFPVSMPVQAHEDVQFSFVHVDMDFYEGTKNAIITVYPMLKPGGIMVFDDFGWPNCPGVKQAIDESELIAYYTNAKYQAYIRKPNGLNF